MTSLAVVEKLRELKELANSICTDAEADEYIDEHKK